MWTAVGLKTLTCGACLPTRESWDYGHKRGSRAHVGMAMVVVILVCCARWKAFLPSCPATSLCARATRVLGLRRPRITFGARGSDGALVAGTGVAARQRRHAARSRVARGYWDCGGRALPRADDSIAISAGSVRTTHCVNLTRAGCQSCARWRLRPCDMDGRRSCQP